MIINHWVQWGTLFSDTPILICQYFAHLRLYPTATTAIWEPHLPRVHPAQTCCVQLMTRWFIAGWSRLSHGPQKRLRFEPSNLRENHGKAMVNPMVNAHEFLANPSSDIHQLGFIWDLYGIYSIPYHPHGILGKSDHSETTLCTAKTKSWEHHNWIHGDHWPRWPGACPNLGVRIVDQIEQCLSMVGSLLSPNASEKKARCQGTSLLCIRKSENSLVYHLR